MLLEPLRSQYTQGPMVNPLIKTYAIHLPHIWNDVLFNTPELKLKYTTLMKQWPFYVPSWLISAIHNLISGNNICHYTSTSYLLKVTFFSQLRKPY